MLARTLGQLYADKAPRMTWEIAPGAQFGGDREDFLELLGNLLDNACKWCRQRVSLTVSHADGLSFVVEDDGPGCAPEALEELTVRGFRADESKPGSGLGLAIVRDIVDGLRWQPALRPLRRVRRPESRSAPAGIAANAGRDRATE